MSSTHRKRNKPNTDNYPTPIWAIKRFLERFDLSQLGDKWIEPCAGDGSIIETVNEFREDIDWLAVEYRDTRADLQSIGLSNSQIIIDDFLGIDHDDFDVVIFNPPFSLLMQFIMTCRDISKTMIVFQTLNFLGSYKRHEWLKSDFPDIYVLPNRVSHKGDGGADSVYSAWFVWGEEKKQIGNTHLLDCTSREERADCNERLIRALDEKETLLRSMFEAIE